MCLLLISCGACVDNVDKFGDSMLLDAAKHGNVDVMQRLLEKQSISIDRQNKKGDTALIRAAWKGELQALTLLLDRGADVTIRNGNGCTALLMAAMHNNRSCFLALLQHSATPSILSATDDNGNNALFYLASFSPLHSAASGTREEPFWEGMNALITRGISLSTPPNMGNLLLCRAANNGRLDTVLALLARGAPDVDPNFVDPNNKCRPALLAHLQSQADPAIIRALLEHGASIDCQDTEGNTALILAVRQNLREVAQLLLEQGAKLELETIKGESALSLATQYGDGGCLALLTEKTAEKLGWNALLLHAAQYGDEQKVRHWIQQSRTQPDSEVDLDYADAQGRTALMMAAKGGHAACVRLLLAANVNVRLVDREGCSALVVAIRSGYKDIAEKIARWSEERGAVTGVGSAGRGEWSSRKGEPLVDSLGEMQNCTRFLLRLGMRLSAQLDHLHSPHHSAKPHHTQAKATG